MIPIPNRIYHMVNKNETKYFMLVTHLSADNRMAHGNYFCRDVHAPVTHSGSVEIAKVAWELMPEEYTMEDFK